MILRLAVAVWFGVSAPLFAQSTWVVNAGGGPGVHFTTLPAAVSAAAPGDTILVQAGPFGEGAVGFSTNKGLTIVGVGGAVPIWTAFSQPVVVNGLPAGQSFRMSGFVRPTNGEINLQAINCVGDVHFANMVADEPDSFFPVWPAIEITNSASVMLRGIETFGWPAVQINASHVTLLACRLGITSLGLGGGPCVHATNSTLHIVQPTFNPAWSPYAVLATNCYVDVSGDGSASLAGGQQTFGTNVPILANGGQVVLDPAVPMPTFPPNGPKVSGTAAVVTASVPASWLASAMVQGQPLTFRSSAPAGAVVFQALGLPGPMVVVPLGMLGLDLGQGVAFFPAVVVPAGGVVNHTVTVPAAMPSGLAVASQSVVWLGSSIALGLPVTAVVR